MVGHPLSQPDSPSGNEMFLTCLYKGGISFQLQNQGFSADTVCNYEVVLANGSIVEENKDSHADLFWALKLASTNFDIVTRLDMRTYALFYLGAVSIYPVSTKHYPGFSASRSACRDPRLNLTSRVKDKGVQKRR